MKNCPKTTIHVTGISPQLDRADLKNMFSKFEGFVRICFHSDYVFVSFTEVAFAGKAIETIHNTTDMLASYAKFGATPINTPSISVQPNPILYIRCSHMISIFPHFTEQELLKIFKSYEGFDSARFFSSHCLVRYRDVECAKRVLEDLNATTNLFANYSTKGTKKTQSSTMSNRPNSPGNLVNSTNTLTMINNAASGFMYNLSNYGSDSDGQSSFRSDDDYSYPEKPNIEFQPNKLFDRRGSYSSNASNSSYYASSNHITHSNTNSSMNHTTSQPKRTLHVTNFNKTKNQLRSLFASFPGFKKVAFYQEYCFVIFTDAEAASNASEELLFKTKLKVSFAKADYVPYIVSASAIGSVNSVLRVSDYPNSTTESELVEMFASYPGYIDIKFSKNYSIVYYTDTNTAKYALEDMNKTTNFTTTYLKKSINQNYNNKYMPSSNHYQNNVNTMQNNMNGMMNTMPGNMNGMNGMNNMNGMNVMNAMPGNMNLVNNSMSGNMNGMNNMPGNMNTIPNMPGNMNGMNNGMNNMPNMPGFPSMPNYQNMKNFQPMKNHRNSVTSIQRMPGMNLNNNNIKMPQMPQKTTSMPMTSTINAISMNANSTNNKLKSLSENVIKASQSTSPPITSPSSQPSLTQQQQQQQHQMTTSQTNSQKLNHLVSTTTTSTNDLNDKMNKKTAMSNPNATTTTTNTNNNNNDINNTLSSLNNHSPSLNYKFNPMIFNDIPNTYSNPILSQGNNYLSNTKINEKSALFTGKYDDFDQNQNNLFNLTLEKSTKGSTCSSIGSATGSPVSSPSYSPTITGNGLLLNHDSHQPFSASLSQPKSSFNSNYSIWSNSSTSSLNDISANHLTDYTSKIPTYPFGSTTTSSTTASLSMNNTLNLQSKAVTPPLTSSVACEKSMVDKVIANPVFSNSSSNSSPSRIGHSTSSSFHGIIQDINDSVYSSQSERKTSNASSLYDEIIGNDLRNMCSNEEDDKEKEHEEEKLSNKIDKYVVKEKISGETKILKSEDPIENLNLENKSSRSNEEKSSERNNVINSTKINEEKSEKEVLLTNNENKKKIENTFTVSEKIFNDEKKMYEEDDTCNEIKNEVTLPKEKNENINFLDQFQKSVSLAIESISVNNDEYNVMSTSPSTVVSETNEMVVSTVNNENVYSFSKQMSDSNEEHTKEKVNGNKGEEEEEEEEDNTLSELNNNETCIENYIENQNEKSSKGDSITTSSNSTSISLSTLNNNNNNDKAYVKSEKYKNIENQYSQFKNIMDNLFSQLLLLQKENDILSNDKSELLKFKLQSQKEISDLKAENELLKSKLNKESKQISEKKNAI